MVLPDGTVQDNPINDLVVGNLTKYAPVIAAFGNIDNIISLLNAFITKDEAKTDALKAMEPVFLRKRADGKKKKFFFY